MKFNRREDLARQCEGEDRKQWASAQYAVMSSSSIRTLSVSLKRFCPRRTRTKGNRWGSVAVFGLLWYTVIAHKQYVTPASILSKTQK